MGQDNAIYKFSIKIYLSSKGQNKSKPQKKNASNLVLGLFSLHGIEHIVKAQSDGDRNQLPSTSWATPSDQQQGIFYTHNLTDRIVHTICYTSCGVLVGSDNPSHHEYESQP